MKTAKGRRPPFRVGDWASVLHGLDRVAAQVVEDRGPLGVGGRRLYEVHFSHDGENMSYAEVPEEDLSPEPSSLRQTFEIIYLQGRRTSEWSAWPRRRGLVLAEETGVVAYRDGGDGMRARRDEGVIVTVYLECDPETATPVLDDPLVERAMIDRARAIADERFLAEHPGATIRSSDEAGRNGRG